MTHYTHKRVSVLRLIAGLFRALISFLNAWPLILMVAFFVSPISPHLRWSYTYHNASQNTRIYHACRYLGARGYVHYKRGSSCPLIVMIDRRKI